MKKLLVVLLFCTIAFAGTMTIDGIQFNYNDKYSFRDFTGQTFSGATDMNNIIIMGSCFSQQTVDTIVFPSNLNGTVFINCNMDNVSIPTGNTVLGGTHKRIMPFTDTVFTDTTNSESVIEQWMVDTNNNKIKLISNCTEADNETFTDTDIINAISGK
jgi:hypothetical protein